MVLLKVSPWKGDVHFGKKGNFAPHYGGPFKILEQIGKLAYELELPPELSNVHPTFHVSNLKKCLADRHLVAEERPPRPTVVDRSSQRKIRVLEIF
ncbi:hypothetical protein E3N88_04224 [Mikania micrantha]|uniref:Tf2-1-like SH3-like domain-containing protein n=1 Tax=Mikania micrantha TaxID=192012 RepID=A0A5N6PVN9_9ASTR|nr:hypothetical protein E3N88_04224 [Mikania micrantha]